MTWKEAEAVLLAVVAGLLGYLVRAVEAGKRIRIATAAVEALASGLVGYLVYQLCGAMAVEDAWRGPIVGVAGWVGASGSLRVLERIVWRRLAGHR